jgi:DedD protein
MIDLIEKKKLLLVSVSVGVFLVIVIGASILVFSPRNSAPAAENTVSTVKPIPAGDPAGSANAVELVKTTLSPQGLKIAPEGGPQDNIPYIYGENPDNSVTVDRTGSDGGNRVVVDVRRPTVATVPETPPPQAAPKPAAAPARQSPAPAPKAAAPKAAAPKTAAPKAAAPKVAAPKTPDNFWVQTGSFSTVARAEAAKDTLASKGIISLIENRDVEGKTFFRVRVGPYTSQKEADYWQKLIKEFNGFEGSMVLRSAAK